MTELPAFHLVIELARQLNKHIVIYDLTYADSGESPEIAAVGCFVVSPLGAAISFGAEIGIGDAGKEAWSHRYADLFKRLADGDAWLVGVGSQNFKNQLALRSSGVDGQPKHSFDLAQLHRELSAKPLLDTVALANFYGVPDRAPSEGAEALATRAAETLNAMIGRLGAEGLAARLHALPRYGALALNQYSDFEVGRWLDSRKVDQDRYANEAVQSQLRAILEDLSPDVLAQGRLRPLLEAVALKNARLPMDYVQLRIGLLRAGLRWSSLAAQPG
jgi:hypothetical protein